MIRRGRAQNREGGDEAIVPEETIEHGHKLVALRGNSNGSSTLTFDAEGRTIDVIADYVVLALPFSTLPEVDLSHSGLSAEKRRVIQRLGMGHNAKVHVEVARKTWPQHGRLLTVHRHGMRCVKDATIGGTAVWDRAAGLPRTPPVVASALCSP